ncbi:MAG: DUF937 domain-containing protein [Acetobacteraceae bacterium]|nr:DUF937 domain-containing protein [Acetobacteraceae bacterium]
MGFLDDAVPGGNIAKPVLVALGSLLVGKMLSGGLGGSTASAPQAAPAQPQSGGLMGGLGGLLDRLTNAGHADTVNSWVGSGQNAPIQPNALGSALGSTTVSELARNAGMSEQDLLAQLSRILPGAVDKLTPNGRVPTLAEIESTIGR